MWSSTNFFNLLTFFKQRTQDGKVSENKMFFCSKTAVYFYDNISQSKKLFYDFIIFLLERLSIRLSVCMFFWHRNVIIATESDWKWEDEREDKLLFELFFFFFSSQKKFQTWNDAVLLHFFVTVTYFCQNQKHFHFSTETSSIILTTSLTH